VPPHMTPPALPERPRTTPRQSAVFSHADTGKVVQGILDLEISLPLRELLGNSKEINQGLQNEIKLKNKASTPSANQIMASQPKARKGLISIDLIYNEQPVTAIIDTGSQLNIIHESLAFELQMPIDRTKKIVMKDANGGMGNLGGLIENVVLRSGTFETTATLWVGDQVPFSLLLGRPWQNGNYVQIRE